MSTQRPHGPVTFDELTAGLIWPKLLRAFPMSLQPKRLLIGVLGTIGIMLAIKLIDPLFGGRVAEYIPMFWVRGCYSFSGYVSNDGNFVRLTGLNWDDAIVGIARHWYLIIPVLAFVFSLFALFSGAIARSAASEVAADLSMSTKETIRFALERWRALVFSILIPLILMTLLCAFVSLFTWLAASATSGSIVQSIASAPAMVVSLMLVLLTLCTIFGHAMLAPAVAVECTDAADAIQRVYAYILGRAGRFVLYLALLMAIAVVANLAFRVVLVLTNVWLEFVPNAESIRSVWESVIATIYRGWLISYYSCAGTLLYLLMRRVNDQQDIREIWLPGMIPGTQAPIIPSKPGKAVDLDDE